MTDNKIHYYYSHISPFSFMGHERFIEIAEQNGRTIDFRPITPFRIFPETGGTPPAKRHPFRQNYRLHELRRLSKVSGVKLSMPPKHFPVDDQLSAKLALVAKADGHDIAALSGRLMAACWQQDKDISDPDTLVAISGECGLDGKGLLNRAQSDEGQKLLDASIEQAFADECFGAPFYVVDGEPFWGQDRLDLVEMKLKGEL